MSEILPAPEPTPESPGAIEPDVISPTRSPDAMSLPLRASYYEGPFVPPEVLKDFEQIIPGSAAKILREHFTQADHRRSLEVKVVDSNIAARKLGMYLGAGLSSLVILGGVVVMLTTSPAWGFGAVASGAALLATSYLKALSGQNRELAQKKMTAESFGPKPPKPASRNPP